MLREENSTTIDSGKVAIRVYTVQGTCVMLLESTHALGEINLRIYNDNGYVSSLVRC